MLKRLELIGFKSFADRTRFDFAPGITAVVGPNGSGKSNIVDAVKWILGEQSAKSLRGGEMADVIFNGSSTRKSLGLAEVTMTFDNAKRQLQYDGDEVQITRRVYRDGQGEYLINGQISRLKDIKEMFLGSGAGQGAYSIIEQGRVDALLTASTKDRRNIFEEAAGISRFKAKKQEALRKLEATELNLNRVKDILLELEKSLKTLQNQAAKAKKHQEYQSRLKELRVGLGLREFAEIADTLKYEEELLARLRGELAGAAAEIAGHDAELAKLDTELATVDDSLRAGEKKLAGSRQQIAQQEAVAKSQREQADNLQADLLSNGQQRVELAQRLQSLNHEKVQAADEAKRAASEADDEQARADAAAAALNVVLATIVELSRQTQEARDQQFELVGRAARLKSATEMTASQVERLQKELVRKQNEGAKASAEAAAIEGVLADLSQNSAELLERLDTAKHAHGELQQQQQDARRHAESLQPRLDELRDRRGDLRGRLEILEQLEQSQEGVGAGVRFVLERKTGTPIVGLVADLLTVPHDIAPLIDLALGEAAQRFVIESDMSTVLAALGPLPGRVGFIMLNPPTSSEGRGDNDFQASITSPLPGLVERLLGNVRLVETLAEALTLSDGRTRFVTRAGEILEADGSVIVGPVSGSVGLLSRKSELRDLQGQLTTIEADSVALEAEQQQARQTADGLDASIGGRAAEIAAIGAKAGDLRDTLTAQREKQTRLTDIIALSESESGILAAELSKANEALESTSRQAIAAEAEASELKATLEATEHQLRLAEATREARQQDNTAAQVASSRTAQQAATAADRVTAIGSELEERAKQVRALVSAEVATSARLGECGLAALRANMLAASAYADKEQHELAVSESVQQRHQVRSAREGIQDRLKLIRDEWQQRQDQAHAHDLTVRDIANRHEIIALRIREDYSIELDELQSTEHGYTLDAAMNDDEVQNEIDDLRKKITRLGSVNLEALEQLAVDEAREAALRAEFDDLTAAQTSLLEIIEAINSDSRRLFTETLAAVRVHFQELFRKLFGGGMADIILEDPTDVLESGIEITARPPGKELRSISLLSGGEKTLTAVALLLAMFRSKPSPFCLLDEVDAALDEANTARLASVVREFLDQSQFIIITHKKRTMAMADVLYGITMQESGISKQVATRIEDWPEDEAEANAA